MTDSEYEIMDELYFVISFQELQEKILVDEEKLKRLLGHLVEKQFVKCFSNVSDELPGKDVDFENNYRNYHYLASKEGLFAHNTR